MGSWRDAGHSDDRTDPATAAQHCAIGFVTLTEPYSPSAIEILKQICTAVRALRASSAQVEWPSRTTAHSVCRVVLVCMDVPCNCKDRQLSQILVQGIQTPLSPNFSLHYCLAVRFVSPSRRIAVTDVYLMSCCTTEALNTVPVPPHMTTARTNSVTLLHSGCTRVRAI